MKTYSLFIFFVLCITNTIAAQSSADSIKLQELGKAYYNIRKLSCSSCQAEGFSVFSKYANEGDVKCMYQLYRCLLKGWGTEQDFPKAISWLKQAAEKGHEAALKELFLAYKDGRYGVEQNLPLACQCAVRLSSLNNSTGLYQYGYLLYKGLGCAQNYEKAMDCFGKAAMKGHGPSMYMLGLGYRNGYGVPVDRDMARTWLMRAAEKGVRAACEELETALGETEGNAVATRTLSRGNAIAETYQQVEHRMTADMSGCYLGTLFMYDYSGKRLVNQKPLSMEITVTGDEAHIRWMEGTEEVVTLDGISNDSLLLFNRAIYHKSDHYSRSTPISWEFVSSALNTKNENGKIILCGNLQQYSPETKEREKPIYFIAEKTSSNSLYKEANDVLSFSVTPNPFRDVMHVSFVLPQSEECYLRLYSVNGTLVMDKALGTLGAGSHNIEIAPKLAPGAYVLRLSCRNALCVITLFKEN